MQKINVAVIGLGYWGPNLIRNFLKIPHVNVLYACDSDEKKYRILSKAYPSVIYVSDYKTILSDPSVDLIAIATPVSTHYTIANDALRAKKHVMLEKPMTDTSKKADKLIALAKQHKKQLFIGHTFVYSEPVKEIKKLLLKNKLGDIFYYDSSRINLGLLQNDINVLWDLAPHDLSIIHYLFPQKVTSVQVLGSSFLRDSVEELVHVFMTLEKNISIHLKLSWLSPVKIRNITIVGSKKMVTYDDIEPTEKLRTYDKNVQLKSTSVTPFSPAYRSGGITIPNIKQKEALLSELEHFIDCIKNNKKPLTGGSEGLFVVTLIEAMEKSLRTGKKIVLHDER